jgi:hypothetical protein
MACRTHLLAIEGSESSGNCVVNNIGRPPSSPKQPFNRKPSASHNLAVKSVGLRRSAPFLQRKLGGLLTGIDCTEISDGRLRLLEFIVSWGAGRPFKHKAFLIPKRSGCSLIQVGMVNGPSLW